MKKIKAILIGAGGRGNIYTKEAFNYYSDEFELIAVADPDAARRNKVGDRHNISEENRFADWKEIVAKPKFADIAFICTQDNMHVEPTIACLEAGYHVLLEKPMAITPEDCFRLSEKAKECDRLLAICHVLRYAPLYSKVKEMIDEGKIGHIENIEHCEQVHNLHQAHSYVRGNWRNSDESSPMILAKCCHDLDLLNWWTDSRWTKVSSFGSLSYFKEENAPEGAPLHCTDGCPVADTCVYNSEKVYVENKYNDWYAYVLSENATKEERRELLINSPYNRCVYHCDNNVVDKQIVAIEYDDGCVATLTMSAFNKADRRTTFMGTKGMIQAYLEDNRIEYYSFDTRETEIIKIETNNSGHGGSDQMLVKGVIDYLMGRSEIKISADKAVQSHLMAFAAEQSRVEGRTIHYDEYLEQIKSKM